MQVMFLSAALMFLCPPGTICVEDGGPGWFPAEQSCMDTCYDHIDLLESNIALVKDEMLVQDNRHRKEIVANTRRQKGLIAAVAILGSGVMSLLIAYAVELTNEE